MRRVVYTVETLTWDLPEMRHRAYALSRPQSGRTGVSTMTQLNLTGRTLKRFKIVSEIGHGGMGIVYKAYQTDLDRVVALKMLPPELTHDTSYVARFQQEARHAARLEHPHIVPMYDIGEMEGLHYIAMKYIEGQTLKDVLQTGKPLPLHRVVEILAQVGEALTYAHEHGILHRDIKPSNIMIATDGWVYLADFGLARDVAATTELTQAGTVMGTPEYMSPEQAQGLPSINHTTDIYALGVVLYEMLTGDLPFEAETPLAMLAARLVQEPRPLHTLRPDLPPDVAYVLVKALARRPEDRFSSVSAMIVALQQAVESSNTLAHQPEQHSNREHEPMPAHTGPTIAMPKAEDSVYAMQHQEAAQQQQVAYRPSSTGNPILTMVRTPLGLLTTLLLLFLLIGGSFRIASTLSATPTPRPIPPTSMPIGAPTGLPSVQPSVQQTERKLLEKAWDLTDMGEFEAAEKLFLEVLDLNPRSYDAKTGLGWNLYYWYEAQSDQAFLEKAVTMFEDSLAIEERQDVAHSGLGWCLYTLDDNRNALEHFSRATELMPSDANAWYGLGLASADIGRTDAAKDAYEQALALDPENDAVQRAYERLHYR